MKVLYFAWLRQKVGRGEDAFDLPPSVSTAGDLVEWLKGRGKEYEAAFADGPRIRVAVNQVHADLAARITNSDEVAFFPPVTGG